MKDFNDKIAVVTGGGTGMGRSLVLQLVEAGCHVATCDVLMTNLEETLELARALNPNVKVTGHECDVGVEEQIKRFADAVCEQHETHHINLLFNNAGINGGGSFTDSSREEWDRTFAVCWFGVYWSTRAFLPMLVASEEGHIVNTSSLNGLWASLGPFTSHTAYSTAKFAVRGFSESLITDLRLNAPHVNVSVVFPGHVGTSIVLNSPQVLGSVADEPSDERLMEMKQGFVESGMPIDNFTPDQMRELLQDMGKAFRDNAPLTADQAATIILNGVKENRWRILVGEDAQNIDQAVRAAPENAYETDFFAKIGELAGWQQQDEQPK